MGLKVRLFTVVFRRDSLTKYSGEGEIALQDMQYTSNVTLRRVLATIVAVGKQYYIFSEFFRCLGHPACNAHAPYCHQ
jgi:hypothetical protein